jgi:FKBP-type peptidyl-prolyl cis-trans isomerase
MAVPQVMLFLLALFFAASCQDRVRVVTYEEQLAIDSNIIEEYLRTNNLTATRTPTGLYYILLQAGNGEKAVLGKNARVHYIGKFLDGYKFDSSYDTGRPLTFQVGATNVQGSPIKAWHEAVQLMRTGDRLKIIVPSGLGYGRFGSYGSIPPNAILIFDMDLLDVF